MATGTLQATAPPTSRPVTTRRQDTITVLLALWLMIGLFVDGWAHNNLDQLETFFTPWHALFYSGFTATALWIASLVARQRSAGRTWREAIPRGYEAVVVGVIVFGIGGVSDWLWHTIFGIEVSIDALLSPTHLVLLTGMLLIFSGPLRSAWADPVEPKRLRSFMAPLLAATLSASLLTFFFMYASGLNTDFPVMLYIPETDSNWEWVALGVLSILWTTLLLVGPMVFLMRRWTPPFGSFTLMFTVAGVLMASIFAFETPLDIIPPVVAGLAADVLVRIVRAGPANPRGVRWTAALTPLALWSVRFVGFEAVGGIGWPPEVWSGTIAFGVLLGLGLALLAFPPRAPAPLG
jgi:hypothetical protein